MENKKQNLIMGSILTGIAVLIIAIIIAQNAVSDFGDGNSEPVQEGDAVERPSTAWNETEEGPELNDNIVKKQPDDPKTPDDKKKPARPKRPVDPKHRPGSNYSKTGKPTVSKAGSTPRGTVERSAKITEADEYYLDEFITERIKGNRAKPIKKTPDEKYYAWQLQLGASITGAPLVENDKIFISCYDAQLLCLKPDTGEMIFQAKTFSQPIGDIFYYRGSNPNTVIVAQRNGNITAFNQDNGKRVWNHRIAVFNPKEKLDLSISGAAVNNKYIYVSKHWGNLYTLGARKGTMFSAPGVTYESRINLPAVSVKRGVLFCNVAGELHCHESGGVGHKWSHSIEQGYPISMGYYSNTILIADTEKGFSALDKDTRKVLWKVETDGYAFNALTYERGIIYLQAGTLYAINSENGEVLWSLPSMGDFGFCRGKVVLDDKFIYAAEQEGTVHKIDRASGKSLKQYNVGSTIRNGLSKWNNLLLVTTTDKELLAVDLSK